MKTISVKSRIGSDGVLNLKIPTSEKEVDVEVVVVLQTKNISKSWPVNFFKKTYGSFKDDPISRLPQGMLQSREKLI
jgi:hypothetical protein